MSKLKRIADHLYRDDSTKKYYFIARRFGKQIKECLKTCDRTLAGQKVFDKVAELGLGLPTDDADLTWAKAREAYEKIELVGRKLKPSSMADRQTNLNAVEKIWPELVRLKVREISEEMCKRWMAKRVETGISAQRLNNELDTLRQVLETAVANGTILRNPAAKLKRAKIPKRRPVFPEMDEFVRIVRNLRDRRLDDAADIVELLAYSGMRLEEAANLSWSDVDWRRGLVLVRGLQEGTAADDPKNLEQRTIPLFKPLEKLLQSIKAGAGEVKPDGKILRQTQCRRALSTACRQVGVRHYSHHSLRKFFTANCVERNIDFQTIASWLGHHDGGVLVAKTYSYLRNPHSKQMAQLVNFSAQQ